MRIDMILKQDNSDKYFPRLIIVPNNQATRENRTSRGGGGVKHW
jgi:hypothetical protein